MEEFGRDLNRTSANRSQKRKDQCVFNEDFNKASTIETYIDKRQKFM